MAIDALSLHLQPGRHGHSPWSAGKRVTGGWEEAALHLHGCTTPPPCSLHSCCTLVDGKRRGCTCTAPPPRSLHGSCLQPPFSGMEKGKLKFRNYTEYVGAKSTFRLLNRGSAKALDKVVELDETKKEALIVKTTIHDIMNQMIRELPITNPVYLMLGTSFGSSAKGTGLKALEFALSSFFLFSLLDFRLTLS
ncbi:hypothetical protein ZWY2020_043332 [Hordeum vulgare]|nr:hypothetical protein ZWY2020_043332 [Hordeum vulgare]